MRGEMAFTNNVALKERVKKILRHIQINSFLKTVTVKQMHNHSRGNTKVMHKLLIIKIIKIKD